jgi:hypothetical protein
MRVTQIAARLRKVAADLEALVTAQNDFDFPDEMVVKFVAAAFTDDNAVKSFAKPQRKQRMES